MKYNFSQFLLSICFIYLSCSEPIDENETFPISDPTFTFHQNANKFYFSINVDSTYQGKVLNRALVYWYGNDKSSDHDKIFLNDGGLQGDIIPGDNIFATKIPNNSINNLLNDDTGFVYMEYRVYYGEIDSLMPTLYDSLSLGNIIPRIDSITAPDTILLPLGQTFSLHSVSAEVFDADGLETIKWVGFTSFHIEGDSLMNDGSHIYLYDDGSNQILYEPNITSGDLIEGDGIFSFRIPVYGTGFNDPTFQTRTGTFRWRFIAQDLNNQYSNIIEHEIIIAEE